MRGTSLAEMRKCVWVWAKRMLLQGSARDQRVEVILLITGLYSWVRVRTRATTTSSFKHIGARDTFLKCLSTTVTRGATWSTGLIWRPLTAPKPPISLLTSIPNLQQRPILRLMSLDWTKSISQVNSSLTRMSTRFERDNYLPRLPHKKPWPQWSLTATKSATTQESVLKKTLDSTPKTTHKERRASATKGRWASETKSRSSTAT